ncbi:UDP-3-O-acylglucosamine N-acyltransferase [Rhodobacteraceae bacterium THAF1]|uniref:UDP-3-O-(3-hydroxymyristoyl)glucosamine N-acyltransferase n=1 Tax=Palleronia sp. THAF1 TaxID=2587842 RepID=UPI000F3D215D|nr:UDP-3-O-(3-hydroxymyristoyl)glucosamine N-acyltransferase [Palleronia sp. THAF1]QFU08562.1 UDP-3-O-acylglucosamine N-acyltransferase [Palleronia sp. THAF1]VDC30619.1 UDP-3-O-acylglucosamine N-acyltransferase [Rhodobacteraceae bacterium THAF1]
MQTTISDIATALSARLEGDGSIVITGASEPADATQSDLALAMQPAYAERLGEGAAQAAILWEGADWRALGLKAALFVQRPRLAMAHLTAVFDPGPQIAPGIHPSAIVDDTAQIGEGAAIGPLVVIGAGARIGANARIASHVSIAEGAQIGDDALILQGAKVGARVQIGDRIILQPGALIGADGLAFVTPQKSGVEKARESLGDQGDITEQAWTRIHSLGTVIIGDDVEIGANTCVDRGTIRATRIGNGCKLDNLIHIAHNVVMGEHCLAAAMTGIAGSTVLGDRVVCGGATGIADNLTIGSDVIFGGGTKVLSNVPAGRVMMGYPAVRMDQHVDMYKALRRLPRMLARLTSDKAVSKGGSDH